MSGTSKTRRCQKKYDTKESESAILKCTFSVTQEMINSGSNEKRLKKTSLG